jgi:5-methylcytosine-specific restriction endonuclease McrA
VGIKESERIMAKVVFDVYPTRKNINSMRRVLVGRHGFQEKENQHGYYFRTEVNSSDVWITRTVLKVHGYKFRCYDNRYERSTNYRKTYFEHNPGPYRCVYCGRRLNYKNIEVDHLIPVGKAKTSHLVRLWLQICGIRNVNDHKNLVCSCKKCNRKKSDKIGFWVVRGAIGRFKVVWVMRDLLIIALFALVMWVLWDKLPIADWLSQIMN